MKPTFEGVGDEHGVHGLESLLGQIGVDVARDEVEELRLALPGLKELRAEVGDGRVEVGTIWRRSEGAEETREEEDGEEKWRNGRRSCLSR